MAYSFYLKSDKISKSFVLSMFLIVNSHYASFPQLPPCAKDNIPTLGSKTLLLRTSLTGRSRSHNHACSSPLPCYSLATAKYLPTTCQFLTVTDVVNDRSVFIFTVTQQTRKLEYSLISQPLHLGGADGRRLTAFQARSQNCEKRLLAASCLSVLPSA